MDLETPASAAARRAQQLAALVNGHPERVEAALPELAALLRSTWDDGDDDALADVVAALGLAHEPRAAELLLPLARAGHPDPEVRCTVARALAGGVDVEPLRTEVVAALVPMTADPVDDVRDWACFALGLDEADDPASRDALAARLDDPHEDTRDEALRALAATGDDRALAAAVVVLSRPGPIGLLHLEAAAELAHPALVAPLEVLARAWVHAPDAFSEAADVALRRCRPQSAVAAAAVEEQLRRVAADARRRGVPHGELRGSWPRTRVVDVDASGRPLPHQVPLRLWSHDDDPALAVLPQLVGTFVLRGSP
ncbi:HEAT repeat domain-containing protein [Quadrisphaera oryzae]|uniref:HEAT repeat domain-containing protein n=1 Tax=Quadrisphaera TaxID=317661 RepID=UPI001644E6CE|nr:HEAT repeat domain-containing protein [Quadrisphaera sp. RL12-1S]